MLCIDLHIKNVDKSKEQNNNYINIKESIHLH